jgi:hypothetical protein
MGACWSDKIKKATKAETAPPVKQTDAVPPTPASAKTKATKVNEAKAE